MNFNNIPIEMQALPQWAVYRSYTDNTGKQKKVIISPNDSKFAKSNEAETWADFDTAKRYCLKNSFKGLVFALTNGITFIDIDHAIDKNTGEIVSEEAKQLMQLLTDTYTERSVSGTGIHILMRGSLPQNARNRNDKKGLEMYDTYRFVCLTGDLLSRNIELKDYSDIVPKINRDYIGVRPSPVVFSCAITDWSPSDEQLIEKIRKSKIAERFNALYSGEYLVDHSSADFALCSLLAWWTHDASQIDRIFRGSGLYRPKWDTTRGNTTYGSLTIERALQCNCSHYEPKKHTKKIYKTQSEM